LKCYEITFLPAFFICARDPFQAPAVRQPQAVARRLVEGAKAPLRAQAVAAQEH